VAILNVATVHNSCMLSRISYEYLAAGVQRQAEVLWIFLFDGLCTSAKATYLRGTFYIYQPATTTYSFNPAKTTSQYAIIDPLELICLYSLVNAEHVAFLFYSKRSCHRERGTDVRAESPQLLGKPHEHCQPAGSLHEARG